MPGGERGVSSGPHFLPGDMHALREAPPPWSRGSTLLPLWPPTPAPGCCWDGDGSPVGEAGCRGVASGPETSSPGGMSSLLLLAGLTLVSESDLREEKSSWGEKWIQASVHSGFKPGAWVPRPPPASPGLSPPRPVAPALPTSAPAGRGGTGHPPGPVRRSPRLLAGLAALPRSCLFLRSGASAASVRSVPLLSPPSEAIANHSPGLLWPRRRAPSVSEAIEPWGR